MMFMNTAYLLLGGNLGDRLKNLEMAREQLALHCGKISKASSLYETAPWGKTDQPYFLNQALEIDTGLNSKQLMRRILKIEKMMGRNRTNKYDPRLIDIDILLFNDEVHNYPLLKLPHPELQNRRFALLPLSEIAAEKEHPIFKKTIRELLEVCTDRLNVTVYH
jgi:2-amino-4-hydroxy-6-hydroxymethyldihydropteridine diphosphokinase